MKIKTSLFTLGLLLVLFASKASAQSISPTPTTSANVATTSSVAPSTIVKTYEFVTDKQPFNYTLAPRSLVENNTTYLYRSIEYDILEEIPVMKEETQTFQREINRMNLSKQNDSLFPSSLIISENGYSGSIARTAVRYQTRTEKVASTPYEKEISYGYSLNTPTPKDHITIEHNGQNVDLKLKEFKEKSSKWQENVLVNAVFISDNELTFTLDNGKELSFDSDNPPYSGIENDILEQLKLDAGTHRITGSSWVNDLQVKDGYCTRTAKYKVSRLVKSYVAVYSGEAQNEDKSYFDATALYSGALSKRAETGAFTYKVNALVTYDAEIKITPSPSPSPTPTLVPTPTLTPSPTPMLTLEPSIEPEIIEEPKKKSGALGTLIMVLVVCGLAGGGFFLWQKKQGKEED